VYAEARTPLGSPSPTLRPLGETARVRVRSPFEMRLIRRATAVAKADSDGPSHCVCGVRGRGRGIRHAQG
jgi:hypothetical protein